MFVGGLDTLRQSIFGHMKLDSLLPKWASLLEERARKLREKFLSSGDSPQPRKLKIRQLEERVMMSAAPMVADTVDAGTNIEAEQEGQLDAPTMAQSAAVSASGDQNFGEVMLAEPFAELETARELVFIDSAAADYDELIADILSNDDPTRSFDIFVLDSCLLYTSPSPRD